MCYVNQTLQIYRSEVCRGNKPKPKTHVLKCWPKFFNAIIVGHKTFEVRKDDRGFKVGDLLDLREYKLLPNAEVAGEYTGSRTTVEVTYIAREIPGLKRDMVVMGIKKPGTRLPTNQITQIDD